MSRYRSQGVLAVGIGLAAAACGDPDLNTDLRSEGPPDVLAVLHQSPLSLNLFDRFPEEPFYCKYVNGKRDEKAPGFVGDPITGGTVMCPEAEADFHPTVLEPLMPDDITFGIRVMFDELLDPDKVETLECDENTNICVGTLAETQPVGMKCGDDNTDVPYTGFYVPNGNRVTYPVGPSIYFQPDPAAMVFPTGSTCTFTIDGDTVTDKDGVAVPDGDRSFSAQIADLQLNFIDPAEGDDAVISPDPAAAGAAAFVFNANIDDEAIDPALFQLKDADGEDIDTAIFVGAYMYPGFTDAVYVFPDTDTGIFLPGMYSATLLAGEIAEINGGTMTSTEETTHFSVAFDKTGQSSGTDFSPTGVVRIGYNNEIDATTLDTAQTNAGNADVELFATTSTTPNMAIPATVAVGNSTGALLVVPNNAIVIDPVDELPLGTYAVRIKAGAEIKDVDGNIKHYNAPVAITYNVLLKPVRTVPAQAMTPPTIALDANMDVVFSGTLDFNPATQGSFFDLLDVTTATPVAVAHTVELVSTAGTNHPNDTIRINPTANLTAGHSYRVVMKPGTVLKNVPVAGFNAVTRSFATATNWNFKT